MNPDDPLNAPFNPGDFYQKPSKSQVKREMLALTAMGGKLVDLSAANLKKIPLDEALLAAIHAAQTMKMGARKRQLQYIGKLLRERDSAPIVAALEAIESAQLSLGRANKQLEQWRARLLAEGDSALGEFCQAHPQADSQKLRQLTRQAIKEQQQQKPPRYFRQLYQALKEASSDCL